MKIYLSSTFQDLKEYRRAVYEQLRKLRLDTVAMEDDVAGEKRPLAQCLQDVAEADVYVGVFAWRYGYIPSEYNPERRSITELEYEAAGEHNKERLIFLLRDDAPWILSLMDSHSSEGDGGRQIQRFRAELSNRHVVGFFSTPDELAKEISAAISILVSRDATINRSKLVISDIQGNKIYYLLLQLSTIYFSINFRVNFYRVFVPPMKKSPSFFSSQVLWYQKRRVTFRLPFLRIRNLCPFLRFPGLQRGLFRFV